MRVKTETIQAVKSFQRQICTSELTRKPDFIVNHLSEFTAYLGLLYWLLTGNNKESNVNVDFSIS